MQPTSQLLILPSSSTTTNKDSHSSDSSNQNRNIIQSLIILSPSISSQNPNQASSTNPFELISSNSFIPLTLAASLSNSQNHKPSDNNNKYFKKKERPIKPNTSKLAETGVNRLVSIRPNLPEEHKQVPKPILAKSLLENTDNNSASAALLVSKTRKKRKSSTTTTTRKKSKLLSSFSVDDTKTSQTKTVGSLIEISNNNNSSAPAASSDPAKTGKAKRAYKRSAKTNESSTSEAKTTRAKKPKINRIKNLDASATAQPAKDASNKVDSSKRNRTSSKTTYSQSLFGEFCLEVKEGLHVWVR